MRRSWLPFLACPLCRAGYDLDAIRVDGPEMLEAFLVCRGCREERLVLGGVAILPVDLVAHLRASGAVYRRTPIADPRMVRFVMGRAWEGGDVVPFEEVLRRYADLAPIPEGGAGDEPAPEDAALARILAAHAPTRGRGLDVGAGVGRGVFTLAERLGEAIGVDRSIARVRRARNLATTTEPFLVPVHPAGADRPREVPLDLSRLSRAGTAFAVADAEALPLADASMDVVVLREGEGGARSDALTDAEREARRVLVPGGLLVATGGEPRGSRAVAHDAPFVAWRAA